MTDALCLPLSERGRWAKGLWNKVPCIVTMKRYICIHCHFYQPPRDNPWLESIPLQPSAAPYHDWNERVTAQCYAPNATARLLDATGHILDIVNNYASMSFNIGPTLLSWLEHHAPSVYQAILAADSASQQRFSGHGSAIAQAYNHMILPLANQRDVYTQIRWGIEDFTKRFGRQPEGMWLPETAVNVTTLQIMAELGIRFTILAPSQAKRTRALDSHTWHDVSHGRLDPTMAYRHELPSGRHIAVFFYHAPIAQAVAFENLLSNGEHFARRLLQAFDATTSRPQLVHIATDGETYGHHHRYGDMALAYTLRAMTTHAEVCLTNYGEFLQCHPPTHAVEIVDNTSWSCAHGVERWRSNCGCSTGGQPGWQQDWRAPLRHALDWLRDTLAPVYEQHSRQLLRDPWAARDDYIDVVLDRSPAQRQHFFAQHAVRSLTPAEISSALQLLEMQRHAMLMYTSCGWFFAEVSGLETVQILQHAMRVMELAMPFCSDDLEPQFVTRLAAAPSNHPTYRQAQEVYDHLVRAQRVHWQTLACEYAARALFRPADEWSQLYCYTVVSEFYQRFATGKGYWASGRVRLISTITGAAIVASFAAFYGGTNQLYGGVWADQATAVFPALMQEASAALAPGDTTTLQRLLSSHGAYTFSLLSLSRDTQRLVAHTIMQEHLADTEAAYRQRQALYAALSPYVLPIDHPLPRFVEATTEVFCNLELRRACADAPLDAPRIRTLLAQSQQAGVRLDIPTLSAVLNHTLERVATQFASTPMDLTLLQRLEDAVALGRQTPFQVNLWTLQNVYYTLLHTIYTAVYTQAMHGDHSAQTWLHHFRALGEALNMHLAENSI